MDSQTGTRAAREPGPFVAVALLVVLAAACLASPRYEVERPYVVELETVGTTTAPPRLELRSPGSIAVDHRGSILIADTGNHRVVVLTPEGEEVTEFGGYGWEAGQFDRPTDLSIYEGFFTYVLDEGNRRVQRFDVDGIYFDEVLGAGEAGSPVAIAVGRSGELLVVDEDSQSVVVRSQFDERLEPFGGFGTGEGGLVRPGALAVGPQGRVAVADPGRRAVLVYDEFGSPLFELSLPDTLIPLDVVFDRAGAVLVADAARDRVVAFPPEGGPPTASIEFGGAFAPEALALDDEGGLLALDPDRGSILLIRMTHAERAPRR